MALTNSRIQEILDAYDQDMPIDAIVKSFRHDYTTVRQAILTKYSVEDLKTRFKRLCAERKQGALNPMFGRHRSKHPNYVEVQTTHSGYLRTRNIPEWYTGPNKDGRVYLHRLKYCEYHGLTDLPAGYVVHHIDGHKQNNSKENLELLSVSEHMTHHSYERSRKEQRLSRKGVENSVLEAPDTPLGVMI